MDKQAYYTAIYEGREKRIAMMFDYEESKWIYEKWREGYSTRELAKALNCSPTTVKRAIAPFKNKKPLVVPEWVVERQRKKQMGELRNENRFCL